MVVLNVMAKCLVEWGAMDLSTTVHAGRHGKQDQICLTSKTYACMVDRVLCQLLFELCGTTCVKKVSVPVSAGQYTDFEMFALMTKRAQLTRRVELN